MISFRRFGQVSAGSSTSVAELRHRLKSSGDLSQVKAIVGGLATVPESRAVRVLARELWECLKELSDRHPVPEVFPLSPGQIGFYRELSATWLAFARTCESRMRSGESRSTGYHWLATTLACLRQIIVIVGICHWPLPRKLWSKIHHLYQWGWNKGLVQRSGWLFGSGFVPEREYLHTVLLGLADLSALLPAEILLLDTLLAKWAPLARLVDDAILGWRVGAQIDEPARWGGAESWRRLELGSLLELLDNHRDLASRLGRFEYWERPAETVTLELLQHWCQCWRTPARETGSVRFAKGEIVPGLTGIFRRLQGGNGPGFQVLPRDRWVEIQEGRVQVGDLVGLFAPGSSQLQGLAVISQLQCLGSKNRAVGVRLRFLAGRVFSVGLQPLFHQSSKYQCALLMEDNGRLTLLMGLQSLDEGVVLRLLYGRKVYPVELTQRYNPARGVLGFACRSAAGRFQK